jgi:microcystin-dependent protein
MPDPFLGEVRMFAGNFAPSGWALCDGQLLPISQNTALFSLLGTTYGGNGTSNFALPDLRGRVPIQPRQGPGLTNRLQGEAGGVEAIGLSLTQMPSHAHPAGANGANATADAAVGFVTARSPSAVPQFAATANAALSDAAIAAAGGSQPHNNLQPYLVVTFIIALQGIYPPRP